MTFKNYIDSCTWEELKSTKGAKEYMQRSLADLKRIEPKYTDETKYRAIYFHDPSLNENEKDNENNEFVEYFPFVKQVGFEDNFSVINQPWDEMLPLEVVVGKEQTPTGNEIVAALIWKLTWNGVTSEENKKAWNEWAKELENVIDENGVKLSENGKLKHKK